MTRASLRHQGPQAVADEGTGSSIGGGSASVSMDPLIGRVLLDRYEVLERVGSGGMGAVYVARQRGVDRRVAVKVLRTDLLQNEQVRERFRREAEIIGRLRHPNSVQLIDFGETDDGLMVMIMELLVGRTLGDHLKSQGALPESVAIRFAEQIAGSLREAHDQGLVHRDLKPANVFLVDLSGELHVKVLDFGIARVLDAESTRLTSTGQVFGTPQYMSPEQAVATGEVDHRSDIYALGLILYEMVAGRPPFTAETSLQYLSAHVNSPPPRLRAVCPSVSPALDELVDRCLAKQAEARPASAADLATELASIASGGGAMAAPGKASGSTAGGWGRAMAAGALVGGVALAVAVFAIPSAEPVVTSLAAPEIVPDAGANGRIPDGGALAAVAAPAGGSALAEGGAADAGAAEDSASADAGSERKKAATTGRRRGRRRPSAARRSRRRDAVTGPRSLVLAESVADEPELSAKRVAERCTETEVSGLSRLTVKACADGCAIILDDALCAGRTPAVGRPVPPGRRTVAVVCEGRVVARKRLRLRAEQTRVLRCSGAR